MEKALLIDKEILQVKYKITTLKDEDLCKIYKKTLSKLEKLLENEPVWVVIIHDPKKDKFSEIPNLTYSEAEKIKCDRIHFTKESSCYIVKTLRY